jgi:RNA polymerase sigma-70 factor (ECF subfamily)
VNDFANEVAALRPALVRIAQNRLHNHAWAEDAVSDTVLAALEREPMFSAGAPLRPWLLGILQHKLVDQVRRHTRERQLGAHSDDCDIDDLAAVAQGTLEAPAEWADPEQRLRSRQFVTRLDQCLQALPSKQGRAFVLRNWLEEETHDICNELGVTANHLNVMLHRARHSLRAALQAA